MKSKWIIVPVMLGVFTVFSTNGFSQRDNLKDKKEQIKQERKDFINRWCGFTDSESSKFWQLHDEMETRQSAIRKENKKALNEVKDKGIDNISEADLKKAMDNQRSNEQKQLDLRWEYNQKFIDAVGVRKTARFYEGLRMFRKTLLDRIRDHHPGGEDEGDDR